MSQTTTLGVSSPIRHLLIGLAVVAVLIFAKVQVEKSKFGRWFNARGYEILHSFMPIYDPNQDLPVIVLDISSLNRDDGVTPTGRLQTIVDALIECRAQAIAIDINFAPGNEAGERNGSRADIDTDFFDYLETSKAKGTKVFVGVHKFGLEPEMWLGLPQHQNLAADMTLTDDDTTELPAWLQCDGNPKLPSISRALAEASPVRSQPPGWLKGALTNYDDPENLKQVFLNDRKGNQVACQKAVTLVNYAKLELVQKLILQTLDRDSIVRAKNVDGINRFQDKLVIVGNAQRDETSDKFYVPGRKPIAGIFLHAMAVNTLVADPVYKLKHWFGILLDALLGSFVVIGLFVIRIRHRKDEESLPHLWENRFISISILATLTIGFVLVKFCDVLWLDFLLVILALFMHSKVHHGSIYLWRRAFTRKAKS